MAALSVSSRRLPGTFRRAAVLWAVVSPQQNRRDVAKHCAGSFPGAACYQPIELPSGEAAPLQGLGMRRRVPYMDDFDVPGEGPRLNGTYATHEQHGASVL
jgi:hypothetical protein